MSHAIRDALENTQHELDALLSHLSLIRDLVRLAHTASSLDDLCQRLAVAIVTALGYERVAVVMTRGESVVVLETYSQATRFGAAADVCPPALLALVWDVIEERAVVRWGGDGTGSRRPAVAGLEGSVVGLPLGKGGECVGAMLCARLDDQPWDLATQRAHELIADIVDQIVTMAQVRLSMRDIQHGLEAELGDSRSTIERQEETLREQSERISGLAAAVLASSRAKNHFLGMMSHELRTPLSVILGFGSILQDGVAGPVNAEQAEYLERVLANGRHLTQLVDDMLFFVDAETTRIQPSWSTVNLVDVVRDICAAIPDKAKPGAPALVVDIPADSAVLRTDATLVRRALFHLLGNAFKFTERGEVRVEARRVAAGAGTEIAITDTGPGIPAEKLERVFELFRQADDGHTRKRDGAGLGLNLVSACVGLLRGRCAVTAGPQGGTRVELWIPEAAADIDARVAGLVRSVPTSSSLGPRGTQVVEQPFAGDGRDVAGTAPLGRRAVAGG